MQWSSASYRQIQQRLLGNLFKYGLVGKNDFKSLILALFLLFEYFLQKRTLFKKFWSIYDLFDGKILFYQFMEFTSINPHHCNNKSLNDGSFKLRNQHFSKSREEIVQKTSEPFFSIKRWDCGIWRHISCRDQKLQCELLVFWVWIFE